MKDGKDTLRKVWVALFSSFLSPASETCVHGASWGGFRYSAGWGGISEIGAGSETQHLIRAMNTCWHCELTSAFPFPTRWHCLPLHSLGWPTHASSQYQRGGYETSTESPTSTQTPMRGSSEANRALTTRGNTGSGPHRVRGRRAGGLKGGAGRSWPLPSRSLPPFGSLCACAAGPHEETAAAPAARLRHVGAARQAHLPHRRQRRCRRWETAGSPPPLRPGAAHPLSPPWASQPRLGETSAFPSALLPLRVAPPARRDAVLAALFLPAGGWAFLLKYLSEILQSL